MKKRSYFLLYFNILLAFAASAQTDKAIVAGIKNNQFVVASYAFNSNWSVTVENSFFIRELDAQYCRVSCAYNLKLDKIDTNLSLLPYIGTNYAGAYYDMGLSLRLNKLWFEKLETLAGFAVLYDSSHGFNTTYTASVGYKLNSTIMPVLKLTNYPEFRIPEERIVAGILFNVYPLVVKPELSIPVNGDIRTSRVLVSFLYNFTPNSKNENAVRNNLW